MGFWNTVKERLKDPTKGIPGSTFLEIVYDQLPIDNVIRMGEEAAKGNWAGVASNLASGSFDVLNLATLGAGSAAKAGVMGTIKGIGAAQDASRAAKAAGLLTRTALTPAGKGQQIANIAGQGIGSLAIDRMKGDKPAAPMALDAAERMAAYKKEQRANAPDAAERMLAYKKSRGETYTGTLDKKPTPPTTGAGGILPGRAPTPKVTGPGELSPLTNEQMEEIALQGDALHTEYKRLLNEFGKQEAAGRLTAEQDIRLAGNIQAGNTQNLATQLASIGMDLSPGPAMVGEQNIAETAQRSRDVASGGLADLLANLETGRTQARSSQARGFADLEKMKKRQQVLNTLADLQDAYGQFGQG
jgi:hypothetical protein